MLRRLLVRRLGRLGHVGGRELRLWSWGERLGRRLSWTLKLRGMR